MPTSALAAFGVLILAFVLLVIGMTPFLFVPVFLIAGVLLLVPVFAAMGHSTTFRRDTGVPSTRDASYDPTRQR